MIMAQERKKEGNEGTRAGVRAFRRFGCALFAIVYTGESV